MPRPLSPEEKILKKMKELLEAWDFTTAIGFPLTVRHWRNRHSKLVERPVVSIRFIDVNPNTDMGRYHNTDEECWTMGVEPIVDVALPAESSDEDETGVGILTVACNQAVKALSVVGIGLVKAVPICDDEKGRATHRT